MVVFLASCPAVAVVEVLAFLACMASDPSVEGFASTVVMPNQVALLEAFVEVTVVQVCEVQASACVAARLTLLCYTVSDVVA